MPANIIKHMEVVWKIAEEIAQIQKDKGIKIDIKALKTASLLHDIFKTDKRGNHANLAYNYFMQKKKPNIASIILKHDFDCILADDPKERPTTIEEKILYYADKRVLHDKIVSIEERLEDGVKRYFNGKPPENEKEYYEAIKTLETELLK